VVKQLAIKGQEDKNRTDIASVRLFGFCLLTLFDFLILIN